MQKIQEFLKEHSPSEDLSVLIENLCDGIKKIRQAIEQGSGTEGKTGNSNASGEEQIALDILSNQIIERKLSESKVVGLYASEELDHEVRPPGTGKLAVGFDPLDGSSLADVNFSVGSIFGIYETDEFIGATGRDQVGALIAVYGPNTTIFFTLKKGVHQFTLINDEFVLTEENVIIENSKKYFAPGNLRATTTEKSYLELMNYWMLNEYKLRYSGGMVPDINHILLKGGGIFCYPGFAKAPQGKLRVLYECAPMALIMEEAGGIAFANKDKNILDIEIEILAQRTPIFIGSKEEVKTALDKMFS